MQQLAKADDPGRHTSAESSSSSSCCFRHRRAAFLIARRSAATASFSAWRSRRDRGLLDCDKCLIFGRCAPTLRSFGFAYGSMESLTFLVRDEKNRKRGKLKDY